MKDCAHVPELGGQQLPAAAKAKLTIEELREYLHYEPETGALRWKKSVGTRARVGKVAGSIAESAPGKQYRKLSIGRRMIWAHRIAFALHYGRWPHPCCDHIDGNGLNNRADNLRECSLSANQHNGRIARNNTSGAKGVSKHAASGLWRGAATLRGKKYCKYFRRFEDAADYARQLREQLHGEFARHE